MRAWAFHSAVTAVLALATTSALAAQVSVLADAGDYRDRRSRWEIMLLELGASGVRHG